MTTDVWAGGQMVLGPLNLVDVSLVLSFLQIFGKQFTLPLLLGKGIFRQGAVVVKLKPKAEFLSVSVWEPEPEAIS